MFVIPLSVLTIQTSHTSPFLLKCYRSSTFCESLTPLSEYASIGEYDDDRECLLSKIKSNPVLAWRHGVRASEWPQHTVTLLTWRTPGIDSTRHTHSTDHYTWRQKLNRKPGISLSSSHIMMKMIFTKPKKSGSIKCLECFRNNLDKILLGQWREKMTITSSSTCRDPHTSYPTRAVSSED